MTRVDIIIPLSVRFALLVAASLTAFLIPGSADAQDIRTQEIKLDDNATTSTTRHSLILRAPVDDSLTFDYSLRLPNTTGLGVGSFLYIDTYTAPAATSRWLAPVGSSVLTSDAAGLPVWMNLSLFAMGTSEWADGDSIGVGGIIYARQAMANGSADTVAVTDAGRLGIGVSAPDAWLTIRGLDDLFRAKDNTGTLRSVLNDDGEHDWYLGNETGDMGHVRIGAVSGFPTFSLFRPGDIDRFNILNRSTYTGIGYSADGSDTGGVLTIRQGGNVGVGLSNPTNKLHVSATSDPLRLSGLQLDSTLDNMLVADNNGVLHYRSIDSIVQHFITGVPPGWTLTGNAGTNPLTNFLGTTDNQGLSIRTNSVEAIRVDTNRFVGIGVTAPTNRLHVSSTNDPLRLTGLQLDSTLDNVLVVDGTGVLHYRSIDSIVQHFITGVPPGWLLEGNAGTNPLTNFLGTTDNQGVSIRTNSVEAIRIDTSRYVGIGTNAPSNRLHVSSASDPLRLSGLQLDSTLDNVLVVDGTGVLHYRSIDSIVQHFITGVPPGWLLEGNAGTNPLTNFLGTTDNQGVSIRTNSVEAIRIDTNRFVGIGTSTPTNRVHITAASDPLRLGGLQLDSTLDNVLVVDGTGVLHYRSIDSIVQHFITGVPPGWLLEGNAGTNPLTNFLGTTDNQGVSIRTNSVEAIRIDTNRYVGIGTNAPSNRLHVSSASDPLRLTGLQLDSTLDNVLVVDGTGVLHYRSIDSIIQHFTTETVGEGWLLEGNAGTDPLTNFLGTTDNEALSIRTNSVEAIRVDTNRFVGIGTSTPSNRLHVSSTSDPLRLSGLQLDSTLDNVLVVDGTGVLHYRSIDSIVQHFITGVPPGWLLEGNAGTNPLTNFLGTTDNQGVSIRTNSVEAIRIDTNRFVGIGTSIPTNRVHITAASDPLRLDGLQLDSTLDNVLVVDGTGVLHYRSIDSIIQHFTTETVGEGWLLEGNAGTDPLTNFLGTTDNEALSIRTNSVEAIRVDTNRFVGIGIAAPTNRLHVSSASDPLRLSGLQLDSTLDNVLVVDGTGVLHYRSIDSIVQHFITGVPPGWLLEGNAGTNPLTNFLGTTDNQGVSIRTNSVEAIRIDTNRFVGIGTSAPQQKLQVANGNIFLSNTGTAGELRFGEPSAGGSNYSAFRAQAQGSDFTYILPDTAGIVGDALSIASIAGTTMTLDWGPGGGGGSSGAAWLLTGNAGTSTATNFLGTTDNVGLVLRVNNIPAFRIDPRAASPNITGGYSGNTIAATEDGNVIAGGGVSGAINEIGTGADYAAILGGAGNDILSSSGYSVIGGGDNNQITNTSDRSSIVGGANNLLDNSQYSSIVGGNNNRMNTDVDYSIIGAGDGNTISGADYSVVGGGQGNTTTASHTVVAGGQGNTASGAFSAIAGGRGLTLSGQRSFGFLGGNTGSNNMSVATSDVAVFGNTDLWLGNNDNAASQLRFFEAHNTIGAFPGAANYSSFEARPQTSNVRYLLPDTAGIAGDVLAVASLAAGTVTLDWTPGSGGAAWLLAGNNGTNPATNFLGTIDNQALVFRTNNLERARVGTNYNLQGGRATSSTGLTSFVWSDSSTASSNYAAIMGGQYNAVTGDRSAAVAGLRDTVSGQYSSIGGGSYNKITGNYSAIPGGSRLTLGNNSFGFNAATTTATQTILSSFDSIAYIGNANLWLGNTDNTARNLRFYEPNTNYSYTGTNYSSFRAQAQAANIEYIFPDTAGAVGDVLMVRSKTGTSVTLDWAAPSESSAGVNRAVFVRKTVDETVSNSTTLQDDDHMVISVEANRTYEVDGMLYVDRNGSTNFNLAFVAPGGTGTAASNSQMMVSFSAFERKNSGNRDVGADVRTSSGVGAPDAAGEVTLSTNLVFVQFKGLIITGTTAGDIKVQWAPTTGATSVTVYKNSYLRITYSE